MQGLNWLIKLFGGFTSSDWNIVNQNINDLEKENKRLSQQCEAWRERCEVVQKERDAFEFRFERQEGRIDQLIELLQSRPGDPIPESYTSPSTLEPLRTQPMSWPRARREFERKDRESISVKEQTNAKVS